MRMIARRHYAELTKIIKRSNKRASEASILTNEQRENKHEEAFEDIDVWNCDVDVIQEESFLHVYPQRHHNWMKNESETDE